MITNTASMTFILTSGMGQSISYGMTASVIVVNPRVALRKLASPTMAGSGATVTFAITFSNLSALASALNVVLTDAIAGNTRFALTAANLVREPAGSTVTTAWSSNGGSIWTSGGFPVAGFTPLILKWTVDSLAPGASGYVGYTVSIL